MSDLRSRSSAQAAKGIVLQVQRKKGLCLLAGLWRNPLSCKDLETSSEDVSKGSAGSVINHKAIWGFQPCKIVGNLVLCPKCCPRGQFPCETSPSAAAWSLQIKPSPWEGRCWWLLLPQRTHQHREKLHTAHPLEDSLQTMG